MFHSFIQFLDPWVDPFLQPDDYVDGFDDFFQAAERHSYILDSVGHVGFFGNDLLVGANSLDPVIRYVQKIRADLLSKRSRMITGCVFESDDVAEEYEPNAEVLTEDQIALRKRTIHGSRFRHGRSWSLHASMSGLRASAISVGVESGNDSIFENLFLPSPNHHNARCFKDIAIDLSEEDISYGMIIKRMLRCMVESVSLGQYYVPLIINLILNNRRELQAPLGNSEASLFFCLLKSNVINQLLRLTGGVHIYFSLLGAVSLPNVDEDLKVSVFRALTFRKALVDKLWSGAGSLFSDDLAKKVREEYSEFKSKV